MFIPSTITDRLLFSVVRVETGYPDGSSGYATGFYYATSLGLKNQLALAVITNRHVIDGANALRFLVHLAAPDPPYRPIDVLRFVEGPIDTTRGPDDLSIIMHPDSEVDLCAISFGGHYTAAIKHGFRPYIVPLWRPHIPTSQQLLSLSTVEEVLMYGFPHGLWDTATFLPLVRRGITSTHPSIDFCDRSLGVIDIAAFPGSSGSPVLIVNEAPRFLRNKGIPGTVMLLGILTRGPVIDAEGRISIEEIPTKVALGVKTEIMMNLGYYTKAHELLALEQEVIRTHGLKSEEKWEGMCIPSSMWDVFFSAQPDSMAGVPPRK